MNINNRLKQTGVILLLCLFTSLGSVSYAQTPQLLNYQGHIVDATGVPLDGATTISFTIYDAAAGGSALWTEDLSIDVSAGYFSTLLGETSPIDSTVLNSTTTYLGIAINADVEMVPRQRMVSTAFAIRSGTSDTSDSVDWAGVTGVPVDIQDGDDDALGNLVCTEGQVAKVVTGVWSCSVP